jgi:hypothetical protein
MDRLRHAVEDQSHAHGGDEEADNACRCVDAARSDAAQDELHVKQDQCIVARLSRFGPKVVASFVSHATAPGVRCHAAPHSVT